jgi:hypothetical protein
VLWNPTSAKTGQIWGTQPLLPVKKLWMTKFTAVTFVRQQGTYSSLRTCKGFWPRILKLAAQPVTVANTAVPTSAIPVASHSM